MVVAGYPSADKRGANVINTLKKMDGDMTFFGIGGESMRATKRFTSFADVNMIDDKPFFPHLNGEIDFRLPIFPPMLKNNIEWLKVHKHLKNTELFEQLTNGKLNPDIMVTVGNPLLSTRLYSKINNIYDEQGKLKPFAIHIDKTSRKFNYKHHEFLDYFFYELPMKPLNSVGFQFPGRFIGKQVVFDVFSFLYKQTDKFEKLAQENAIFMHPELNSFIMEEVIFQLRNEYRNKHAIPDSAIVMYVSLGNTKEEIWANGKAVADGLKIFADKYAAAHAGSPEMHVLLNLPERDTDYEQTVYALTNTGLNIRATFGDAERYEAMAASDLGACADGDAVLECAAMQLPTQILNHSGFFKSYLSLLYNVYENDINILADGEVLPELLGRNFGAKIAEFWSQWLESPKQRYKLAVKTNKLLIQMLPKPSINEEGTLIAVGSDVFTMYTKPQLELEAGLRKAVADYRELRVSGLRREQYANQRDLKLGLGFE